MPTIEIDEQTGSLLTTAAASRRITPGQLASSLLRDALADENEWSKLNQRRIDLIRKGSSQNLTASEQQELQQLQDEADQRVEKSELALLDTANHLRAAVESLPHRDEGAG